MDTITVPTPGTDIEPVERLRQELGEIELKVTTGYTLADAIREGAGVTQKLEGDWVREGAACSLGAAWIAARARGFV